MSGTALTIPYTSFVSQSHIMSQTPQFNVNIIRSFTRLKSIFISFYADAPPDTVASTADEKRLLTFSDFNYNQTNGLNITGSGNTTHWCVLKPCNRFYHPMGLNASDEYSSTSMANFCG
jgi:hypothetical protein